MATRGARVVLVDDNGVRATMTASWLKQIGSPDMRFWPLGRPMATGKPDPVCLELAATALDLVRHLNRGVPTQSFSSGRGEAKRGSRRHRGYHGCAGRRSATSRRLLAVGQHDTADRDLVHFAVGLADHGKCVVPDLAVGAKVIRSDEVAWIDL